MDGGEDDWLPATQQMMPATQVLNFSDDEDENPLLIGILEICGKQHKIYSGQCRIGRDKTCEIVLSQPSLSRVHAIIEGDNDGVTIHDAGSSNGTRKQNIKLRKNIRYNLTDGETIKFGDVDAKFKIVNTDEMDETASVGSNASESLMALDEDQESTLDNQAVIEAKTAGVSSPENDENRPPNFVPETPANFGPRGRRLLGSDEYFVPGSQSSPLPTEANNLKKLQQEDVFKVPDSPNTSNLNDSSFLMSSQPVISAAETFRPTRQTITKTRIDLNNDSDVTIAMTKAGGNSDVEENLGETANSVSRVEESQSLFDDDIDKSKNSSQNITNISDTELMAKETQAVKTSMSDSQLFNAETQHVSKMSDSLLMMQPTQAPCAKLSESELMIQPTPAPFAKLSESELMMQPTQAPLAKLSDSELMMVETQALSMSKLSESQLMALPTQAFNLSESQMFAVETQTANKLSQSDLMLASTQAICRLSESEIMSAETQNMSNLSDSKLMSAATQVISPFVKPNQKPDKSTDSELMIAPTQKITIVSNVVKDIEKKSESESMNAETQAFGDDKEANKLDSEEEEEVTQKVDQDSFSNQDVEGEEGNEETMPFDLSPAISNESLNLMDEEENVSEEELEEEEQQDAPVDINSEDLINADTQSVPSMKNDSEEIMLLKTQSIERESDEVLPSSNDKVESSQSLFDAETDDFMAGIDSKSNTPVESEVLVSKDKEGVEDKNESDSEDDMFIESSQGPIQNNRSRLRELSTMSQSSVVPSSQLQDDLNVKSKNPVQVDSESNVSEADSDNLMDNLENGDVTDDDLQALFDKNRRQDSEKLSQTLSIPGSQTRPSSEVIPPSQEAEKLPKGVKSKLALTTNYSLKSMEETNLDYQSSQETDSEFKETLSDLIHDLEVSRNDIEETMIEGNNETVTGDNNIQNISLDNIKSDDVVVKTPIKVSSHITKGEEEVSSPIIAKNHSSQSIKSLDTSSGTKKSSLANILGNDESDSEDDEPLAILPDIDQDLPIAATDELEIRSDIIGKDPDEDGVDQKTKESKTPQRQSLKLAEIILKTPTQVRLCQEVKEGSPMRPESGPFLPDTLELLSNEKDGATSAEAKNDTAKEAVKKNISIITPEEEEIPEECLGRGRRVRKSNSKYEEENVATTRKSLPENPPIAKTKRGRKSVPAASIIKDQLVELTDSSLPQQNSNEQKGIKGKKSRRSLDIKMTSVSKSNQECSFVDETKIIVEETHDEVASTKEALVSQDSEILFPGDKGDPEMASAMTQIDIKVSSKSTSPVLSNPEECTNKDSINPNEMTESQILDDTPLKIRAKRKGERLSKQSSPEIKSSEARESSESINEEVEAKKPASRKSRASNSVKEKSVCIDDAQLNKRVSLRGVKVDILRCNVEQAEEDLHTVTTDKDDLDKHEVLTKDDVETSKVQVSKRRSKKIDQEPESVERKVEVGNKVVNQRRTSGGRRGRSKENIESEDKPTKETKEETTTENEIINKTKPARRGRGKGNNAANQPNTNEDNKIEELSKEQEIDDDGNNQLLVGRRGRGKSKEQVKQDQSNEVNENHTTKVELKPTRGRRGRSDELREKNNVVEDTTIKEKTESKRRGRPKAYIKEENDDLPANHIKQETQVRRGRASKAQLLENISSVNVKVETLIDNDESINESIKEEVKGKNNRRFTLATTSIKEEIKDETSKNLETESAKPAKRSTRGRPPAVKSEPKSKLSQIKKETDEEIVAKEEGDSKTNSTKRKRGIKEEFIVKDEGSVSRRKRSTRDAGMSDATGSPQKKHKSETKRDESTESVRSTRSSRSSGKSSTVKEEEVIPKSSDLKRKLGSSVSVSNKLTNKVKKGSRSGSDSSTCGSQSDVTGSPSLRKAANKAYKVMFTGYDNENERKMVKDLGGEVVEEDEVHECNVLVTDKVRRTVKFLCMLGRGTPIVSPAWIKESKMQGSFVNPNSYIIKDREMERKFSMDLDSTFELVTMRGPLLKGLSFFVTKKVKPTPDQFKEIIECAGGTVLTSSPTSADPKTYVISCVEDKAVVDKLKRIGVRVMDKEFILTGLFKYSLDTKLAL